MKNKNLLTIQALCILAVVQIIVLIGVNVFSFKTVKAREISKPLLKGASVQNITSFELKDKIEGFKVVKEKDQWFVEYETAKLPADQEKVDNYLKVVSDLGEGMVIYKGSDNSTDLTYGLDAKNVLNVTVKLANKKEYKIEVGNAGSGRGTSYVRKNGENRVRLCDSAISSVSNKNYKDWTDRRIIKNVTVKDFKTAVFKFNASFLNDTYTISTEYDKVKKKDIYKVDPSINGKELDDLIIKGVINSLVTLKADNFKLAGTLSGKTEVGSLIIEQKNGKKINLKFYNADPSDIGNFIVYSDVNDCLYLYHEDSLKTFVKAKDELYKK